MRPLEVVGLHEKAEAPFAVRKVRKHRARQELIPKRLPESLDFPKRLWMLWTALDVANSLAMKLALEVRRAAPRRVLPPLIRQDFARHAVRSDGAAQCLHHQLRALMVPEHVRDEKARMIIHEAG